MSFKDCDIPKCIYQALVLRQNCQLCSQKLCYYHYDNHGCHEGKNPDGSYKPSGLEDWYQPEVSQLMELLKPEHIKAEVESLRPDHHVSKINIPEDWKDLAVGYKGSCNFHIKIDFQDGESWMMRIRRRAYLSYSDQPLELNLASEVATNKALHKAGLSVPNAFQRPSDSKLHKKLIYCYQTFIPGDMWRPFYSNKTRHLPLDPKSLHHTQSIVQWFLSMEQLTFDKVGSICFANKTEDIEVGPLIERHPAYVVPPYYQGPFKTARDRWMGTIQSKMSLVLSRNYCEPSQEVKWYLILLMVRNLVEECGEMRNTGPFFIKHDDDRYDHIRATEDGEVTGIIDWEWAYTTNKEEAFAAPNGFVPAEYEDGKNDILSTRELAMMNIYTSSNRPDLADYVRNGRKYHRLIDLFRNNSSSIKYLNALQRAFSDLPDDHPGQPDTIKAWLEVMKEKYKDDEGLQFLLAKP